MTFQEAREELRKACREFVAAFLRYPMGPLLHAEAAQLLVERDELLVALKAMADRCEADTRFMFEEAAYGVDREKEPTMPEEVLVARALIESIGKAAT